MADALAARVPLIPWGWMNANPTFTNISLDSSTKARAIVFCLNEDAELTGGGFRYGSRTGTPPAYRLSLQSVDGTGHPTGTVLASQTFTPPADATWNGTWQWVDFSASHSATAGTVYALVIDYSTGTVNGSNFSSFTSRSDSNRFGLPYCDNNTTGSYSKDTTDGIPVFAVRTSGGAKVYGFPLVGVQAPSLSTNGHRGAVKLVIPDTWLSTYQITAVRLQLSTPATGNTYVIGVWNAAGTSLQSTTVDSDHVRFVTSSTAGEEIGFTSPATLSAGTAYYIGIERVAASCGLNCYEVGSSSDLGAYPLGSTVCYSQWNGSTWSDTATYRPMADLILRDISASSGGGGPHVLVATGATVILD